MVVVFGSDRLRAIFFSSNYIRNYRFSPSSIIIRSSFFFNFYLSRSISASFILGISSLKSYINRTSTILVAVLILFPSFALGIFCFTGFGIGVTVMESNSIICVRLCAWHWMFNFVSGVRLVCVVEGDAMRCNIQV